MKYIIKYILRLFFYPFKYIIPKNNTIIISSNSAYNYSGNAKYLFEYLSIKQDLNVVWYTENTTIKKYLNSKKYNYISLKNPVKLIYVLLRTKIVVNDGDAYVNFFDILDNPHTVKVCTFHGCAAKAAIYDVNGIISPTEQKSRLNKFNYINFPSYSSSRKYAEAFEVPKTKVFSAGFPRCDQFFLKDIVEKKYDNKLITKKFFPDANINSKVILYTPTWRPYEYNLPLLDLDFFDEKDFNNWLTKNNCYFFYTIHTTIEPKSLLSNTNRIKYINSKKYPMFDINEFMNETDILLNDYSATTTDYALLNRAQIFCMPDYEKYWNFKGVSFIPIDSKNSSYRDLIPGPEVHTYEELLMNLKNTSDNYIDHINKYQKKSDKILNKFYNIENSNSLENMYQLMRNIITS
tara:strand:- start:1187 stop:2404 length:1218 start_codon:yes stop_codon:yes gene_type:complete